MPATAFEPATLRLPRTKIPGKIRPRGNPQTTLKPKNPARLPVNQPHSLRPHLSDSAASEPGLIDKTRMVRQRRRICIQARIGSRQTLFDTSAETRILR